MGIKRIVFTCFNPDLILPPFIGEGMSPEAQLLDERFAGQHVWECPWHLIVEKPGIISYLEHDAFLLMLPALLLLGLDTAPVLDSIFLHLSAHFLESSRGIPCRNGEVVPLKDIYALL